MYGRFAPVSYTTLPAGSLLLGGLEVLWYVVATCTLIAATLALARMLPRRER